MNIAGFQPLTLSDFPGRTAALIFTQGCNLRCPFCHNHELIEPCATVDADEILAQLQRRRHLLDGVVISGGEPTLQVKLIEFIENIKTLGMAIKLDTNGTRPEVLADLLQRDLLDYVAMDLKASWDRYADLAGVDVDVTALQQSVQLILASGIEHQFRTTWVKSLLSKHDLQRIQAELPSGANYRVQEFVPELAMDPALRVAS